MSRLLKFTSRNYITDRWLQNNTDIVAECWNCSKSIEMTHPRKKYCSRSCMKKYHRRINKPFYDRLCVWCDNEFTALRSDKIYCSVKCIRDNARFIKGIPRLGHFKRNCIDCKWPFVVKFPPQRYCSFSCFQRHRANRKKQFTDNDMLVWNQMREKFWFGTEGSES